MISNRQIIVRLIGGLGNQLFQIQYAMGLQERIGGMIQVDDSFLAASSKAHEKLAIVDLNYPFKIIRLDWTQVRLRRNFEKVFNKLRLPVPNFLHQTYHFDGDERNLEQFKKIIIDGFWQDSKNLYTPFLEHIRKKLFNIQCKKKSPNSNVVCVHIRRGDYLNNKNWRGVKQLSVLSLRYYFEAFEYFEKKINDPVFEIYSDDEPWAIETFRSRLNVKIIQTKKLDSLELLSRMAGYENYIIANSSLSWWAAVLATKITKIVVMPMKWTITMGSERYRLPAWTVIEN